MDIINCSRKRKRPSYLSDYVISDNDINMGEKKVIYCL